MNFIMVSIMQPFTANQMEIPQSLISWGADEGQSSQKWLLLNVKSLHKSLVSFLILICLLFSLVLYNVSLHFLPFCLILSFSTSSSSPSTPELSSPLLADGELLSGKGQLMIGSCVCALTFDEICQTIHPSLVFVIVMKDRKKDSRDSSFSLIPVTHSWGNTSFFSSSFRPLPNYSCILLSQPPSPWRGSETEEAQSR